VIKMLGMVNLFIIPGNPPAVHYYDLWGQELVAAGLIRAYRVSAYPRFELRTDSVDYFCRVADHHAQAFLDYCANSEDPVRVLGHSLGGSMALEILERHSALVVSCILLHPFLRAPAVRGQAILSLLRRLHYSPLFEKSLLRFRPLLQRLVSDFKNLSDEELKTFLNLAFHESVVMGSDRSPLRINPRLVSKIQLLYCQNDTWCPPETVAQLASQLSLKDCGVSHAFVVSAKERAKMTTCLADEFSAKLAVGPKSKDFRKSRQTKKLLEPA